MGVERHIERVELHLARDERRLAKVLAECLSLRVGVEGVQVELGDETIDASLGDEADLARYGVDRPLGESSRRMNEGDLLGDVDSARRGAELDNHLLENVAFDANAPRESGSSERSNIILVQRSSAALATRAHLSAWWSCARRPTGRRVPPRPAG